MKFTKAITTIVFCVFLLTACLLPAFAVEPLSDTKICVDLGLLRGSGQGVTQDYLRQSPTRLQAATIYIRLLGLEKEALSFTGSSNFTDSSQAWDEGRSIMAYLKANPKLGWQGRGNDLFCPNEIIGTQEMYKVLLVALGYREGTDFNWAETQSFASSRGLSALVGKKTLETGDLCISAVESLRAQVNGGNETLASKLVNSKVIPPELAVSTGLIQLPPPPYIPPDLPYFPPTLITAAPSITPVFYGDGVLRFTLDCETPGAEIYYSYDYKKAPEPPTTASLQKAVSKETIEISASPSNVPVYITAIAVAPGTSQSVSVQIVFNSCVIESVLDTNIVTQNESTLFLKAPTTIEQFLKAVKISPNTEAQIIQSSGSAPVTTDYKTTEIKPEHILRLTAGKDFSNDYTFSFDPPPV